MKKILSVLLVCVMVLGVSVFTVGCRPDYPVWYDPQGRIVFDEDIRDLRRFRRRLEYHETHAFAMAWMESLGFDFSCENDRTWINRNIERIYEQAFRLGILSVESAMGSFDRNNFWTTNDFPNLHIVGFASPIGRIWFNMKKINGVIYADNSSWRHLVYHTLLYRHFLEHHYRFFEKTSCIFLERPVYVFSNGMTHNLIEYRVDKKTGIVLLSIIASGGKENLKVISFETF